MSARALADKVFAYRIQESWYLQLRRGLPIEHLRVESDEAFLKDARFAEQVLAELRTTRPVDEDDRLTAGYLDFMKRCHGGHPFRFSVVARHHGPDQDTPPVL